MKKKRVELQKSIGGRAQCAKILLINSKNILHLLLLKPRIMPWLRASRLGLKAARSTGDYHIIHMLFFFGPLHSAAFQGTS